MKRREFIALLGLTTALPLTARAQQPLPVIGFLSPRAPEESTHLTDAFRRGLGESGFAEGRNLTIEYRWARGDYNRLPAQAAELVRLPVSLLVALGGEPAARAASAATSTIPIVASFSADPVKSGLVSSLGHPGGNITGVSNLATIMEPKRIGLLRELVPQAKAFAALVNPQFPTAEAQIKDIRAAAQAVGIELHLLRASDDREIEAAIAEATQQGNAALLVAADSFFNTRREQIAALAARNRMPAMYTFRDYAVAGGLMSYGIDLPDIYHQVGNYTGRILKGEKSSELPVLQPTKFEFVINLKTAKALGIKLSDNLLSLADEVIE